jgi:hypothetical protein
MGWCSMRSDRPLSECHTLCASPNEWKCWKSKMAGGTAARELAIRTSSLPPRTDLFSYLAANTQESECVGDDVGVFPRRSHWRIPSSRCLSRCSRCLQDISYVQDVRICGQHTILFQSLEIPRLRLQAQKLSFCTVSPATSPWLYMMLGGCGQVCPARCKYPVAQDVVLAADDNHVTVLRSTPRRKEVLAYTSEQCL